MARKIKIPNETLKRYAREEHKRRTNAKSKRKYYLIVCEGSKTEPNYFEGLKNELPRGVLTAFQIDIEGTGFNTESLVDEAIRLKGVYEKETGRPVDRLWTVFDKDSFSLASFNAAIQRCATVSPAIGCAWSNEAFELWYLLHFHFYNTGVSRADYQVLIEGNLRPHLGEEYQYQKNSENMYALLKQFGNQEQAIQRARQLEEIYSGRQDYANHNPCTMVYRLVEELLLLVE